MLFLVEYPLLLCISITLGLFSFKLFTDTLQQYLVPVPKGMLIGDKIAPSNCMFDMMTQTFFENQGTGTFTYGKDN